MIIMKMKIIIKMIIIKACLMSGNWQCTKITKKEREKNIPRYLNPVHVIHNILHKKATMMMTIGWVKERSLVRASNDN